MNQEHEESVRVCGCVCVYVSNMSTGTDRSSLSELRADSCWSDTVSAEEDIRLPP